MGGTSRLGFQHEETDAVSEIRLIGPDGDDEMQLRPRGITKLRVGDDGIRGTDIGQTDPRKGSFTDLEATSLTKATGGLRVNNGLIRKGEEALTVSSGVVTPTQDCVWITPEVGTSDDVDTIAATNAANGDRIVVQSTLGNTITLKHNTGNLRLGADVVLSGVHDTAELVLRNGGWKLLSQSAN